MEEKKLSVDIQPRTLPSTQQIVQKMSSNDLQDQQTRIQFETTGSRMMGEGINDNWFELRFSSLGPDRRGYHSTFSHNKK